MLAFLVAGLVIVLGFIGEEFFKRTSIPDPLLLLLFGVLLGPVLNVFYSSAIEFNHTIFCSFSSDCHSL